MSGAARRDANSRSRYAALNINPPNQRGQNDSRTGSRRGNMQSLGKISGRRMPAPAQLKSLKSENEGNDPTVNLVPQGGGGWRNSHKEEEEEVEPKKEEEPRRQRWNNPPPQPQPRAGPENFRSDFPSLEEHEKMTKKERDELHQRQLEEAERREKSHSPYHDFPKHPDGGPWRGQGYPPPHPRRGGGGQGPMRGNHSYYRMGTHPDQPPYPSHQQPQHGGYPPMAYRQHPPPYYSKNPYEISPNPYKMPPGERKWEAGESRPPTVKSDDIDNMDEEGDVGWAGHYEEVDYSKEVVFEDSSDEESPKEEKKGRTHSARQRGDKVNQSPKALHQPKEKPQEQPQPSCWKQIPSQPAIDLSKNEPADLREEMNAHPSLHSPPPHGYSPSDQFSRYNLPLQSRRGDHWVSHPYASLPYSRGPMKHRRGNWEHEERDRGRSNFHPHWDAMEADGQNRHRSSLDRPKILMAKHTKEGERDNTVVTPTSPSERLPAGKEEKSSSHVEPTAAPQSRMPPKKIMIRNLSERSNEDGSDHSSPKEAKDISHTPTGGDRPLKSVSSSTSVSSPVPTESSEGDSTRAKVAWDSKDRGPITSQKTLYEPEGKKSEAKFHNYQRMATETITGASGGKLLRVSSSGSAKGEQTTESPKNSSAGILGEAPIGVEFLERVQFHGRVQRRPHGDHPSPLSPPVQQPQPIGRRETDSGRPPRRGEHDRGEHSKGRRRDSRDSGPEERKVSQRKQKSQPREEQSEGTGRGRRRGDVETRQRQREVEKRDGQKEREVPGSQDSSKKQELNRVGREKPHESNERGEGRRSRPASQSHQERERGTNNERHDQQRAHDVERPRDRHRERRRGPDSDWSKDKNWDSKSRESDLPRERKDDSSGGQATDKPRERNRDRDQRTRDKHTDSFKDYDSAKERDSRRGKPSQDQKKLQEDSHQHSQSTDRSQSGASLGNVADGNRRKHKSETATTKPSAEYKDLPNRVVQELPTEDADKKAERAPVSRDQDRERDRRRDRQRPRDGTRGEERRRGRTHANQQEHQVSERNLPRQGQKRETNDQGARRQARERRDETGEVGDDRQQQPSGVREPERSGRGRGKGRGGSRSETRFPKDSVKVYEQLEDIESASDWENDETMCLSEETGETRKGELSSSEHTRRPRREERQRPGSGGGDRRSRIGRGRGRGQPPSERQEHPAGNRRREQRYDSKVETYSRSQGASSSIRFGDIDEIEPKPNRRNMASSQETKRAEDIPHKGQDISRFDVNSQGVVVVDEEGYDEEALPRSPLVSGESDGFQVVRTKREKQKDKEEKKKMEEKERRKDRDHHYRSHSLLPSGSVSQHGSNLPLNKPTADQSATWGVLPDISEPSNPLWTEWSGNELPLSFPSNFGAVGEKFQKDQFHKPSSTPQPGSTLSDKDQSYQLFSPQTYPLGPTVAPRTGDMLMAAVDQSVRIPFSASQVPKEKPASLSEILENEGVSSEKHVEERVRDSSRTQKQTGSHSGQQKGNVKRKATDDRFYIPPHTRQDTTARGSRRHPSSSIRSSKSSITKSQTKVTGLADAHLEGTGACDDHVTEPGRLQQCQRAGEAETHILEVCQDTTEQQCSSGHCKVTQQVPSHIGRPRKGNVELTTQKQAMETRGQCNVERMSSGVELDLASKSKSYASALMSVPLHQKLSNVAAISSSCSSTTSTHGSNSPVPLDSSVPGEDGLHGEGDDDESVEERDAIATQPEENENTRCASSYEDREIDGKEGRIIGSESLSQEIILPPSPSDAQCQSSTMPISPQTGLSNFSPTDSPKGVHQAIPLVPKLSSLSSPRIGSDDPNYSDSTLLRSTSALGIAPDSLASHFSSSSPPNSLPDVTSPFIKVRLSSALTRTSSAPCPLPQAAPGPVDMRDHSPVSPLSKIATAISSVNQPDSEPGKVLQRGEEIEGEPDDRSDSSISKSSSLSIMADEFVPKYGIATSANVNQYSAPRVQPSPVTTVGSAQHQSWPKSSFSHPPPPPPPPQHQQQSLLNQPSFPTHIQLHVMAAAHLQIQQQLAAASANDQRISNIPTQRVFHQPLQIPVPIPQLSHPVSPQQPPPPVLHPTLPMAIHHCPPLQVQNMAIRHPAMTMASKPNFPPSMLQYGEKEREKAGPLGSVLIQQQIQQQHHRQQKSLKPLPAAQPSAPMHRHPQQLTLLPTAPPHHHQIPLQAQSQISSSLVLGRQHSLAQLGLQQNLALFPQATVTNPVDVIRRQPSSRPPLLPTPPDFTLITAARTTTTPGVHPPVVNSTISPPITWPPQVRISATHDSSLGPLPLNPPISLPN